jgi:hypothetical protein
MEVNVLGVLALRFMAKGRPTRFACYRRDDIHPLVPRTRGSNSDVRMSARSGRPIKATPSPSQATVVAGGAVNASLSRRLI